MKHAVIDFGVAGKKPRLCGLEWPTCIHGFIRFNQAASQGHAD
jgi:hypothetical protein